MAHVSRRCIQYVVCELGVDAARQDNIESVKSELLTIMIRIHLFTGTSFHTGKVSTNGIIYKSMNAASGAWLKSNCMLFILSFLW